MRSKQPLFINAVEWVNYRRHVAFIKSRILLVLFVLIIIVAAAITLAIAVLGQLAAAGKFDNTVSWYVNIPIIAPQVTGFLLSLIGIFVVQAAYQKAFKDHKYIMAEKMLFDKKVGDYAETNANRELDYAKNVAKLIGYGA